jgi:hypothetical protein
VPAGLCGCRRLPQPGGLPHQGMASPRAHHMVMLQYPDGESAMPFVFICENPQELVVRFPIKVCQPSHGAHVSYHAGPAQDMAAAQGCARGRQEGSEVVVWARVCECIFDTA